MKKNFLMVSGFSGATAVALGAFAAHGLKEILSDDQLKIFHTGVEYHFYHTFALFAVVFLSERIHNKMINFSAWLFTAGIILFSGSLYLLATLPYLNWIGIITPIGGLCFILGWLFVAFAAIKSN
ncbi:MAG: DUF423 domain-containing protein [Chitinophagales bacterium]|nr:DUF423 domain-containing protein [Chitinophagales bacterium]